ncbi:hypothetical protein LXA43DRAFT_893230 [Ganoderma leucocontextum]|nr:hypothetical protein LXA43DRAFT_893230 [Ganoderma leucocontextum]
MAPVFSRLSPTPLPDDVLRMVASLLSPGDLRNLIVSCKACHLVGVPVLYRSVEAWLDPANFHNMPFRADNRPLDFLLTIINSTLPGPCLSLPSRCYAAHLVTFTYGSWSTPCDFRGLPLLAEALRFTDRLRHLRIDVPSATVPILVDLFRRSSIIITPSTMLPGSSAFDRRPLPLLQSIRTSRIAIADALMQYRAIQTVAVDLSIKWEVLAKFLRAEAPWDPTHLRQLSIHVAGHPTTHGLLEGMLTAFPRVQHLAIRVSPSRGQLFNALRVLTDLPDLGRSLRTLSINHASTYPNFKPVLKDFGSFFADGYSKRPALRQVVMGATMWMRATICNQWSFVEFERSYELKGWAWLEHRNEGDDAPTALKCGTQRFGPSCATGFVSICPWPPRCQGVYAGGIRPANTQHVRGVSQTLLSPFEQLLLGEHPRTVDNICFCWTPDVLMKIRRLSTSTFYAVEAYFCRQWNVNIHLRRWFGDVPHFLRQLGDCDGLVAGSEALTFFDRRRFLGNDLDVYLPPHGVLPMGRYLKTYGYVFQPSSGEHLWFDAAAMLFLTSQHGIRVPQYTGTNAKSASNKQHTPKHNPGYGFSTFDFIRPSRADLPATYGTHVQLIGVNCDPMEFIINNFHSTGVMNMLTPTHAISLFPHTTFIKEETFNCRDLSDYPGWNAPWVNKYRKRGFNVFVASDRLPRRRELVTWKRKVGDTMTWILPYTRTGLNAKAPTLAPYSRYTFEVLDVSFGVAPPGAVVRVGPRFSYRQVLRCTYCNRDLDTPYVPVPWPGSRTPRFPASSRLLTRSKLPPHSRIPLCRHLTTSLPSPMLTPMKGGTLRRRSS